MIRLLAILLLVSLTLGLHTELKAQSRATVLYKTNDSKIAAPIHFFPSNIFAGTNITVYTNGDGTITIAGTLIAGSGTNALVFTNGVAVGSIGTVDFVYGITGYVASGQVKLGVSIAAGAGDAGGTNSRQWGTITLTNVAGLADFSWTNVPFAGTNISIRTSNGTNYWDIIGQLNNWAQLDTNNISNLIGATNGLNARVGNLEGATNGLDALVRTKQHGSMLLTNFQAMGISNIVAANGIRLETNGGVLYITNTPTHSYITLNAATNGSANTNIVVDCTVRTTVIYLTNNASLTNFDNLTVGTSGSFLLIVKPQLISRTIVWPAVGSSFNMNLATNVGAPLWTTFTNGVEYWVTGDRFDTNMVLTMAAFFGR